MGRRVRRRKAAKAAASPALLLTCEHGGNRVPREQARLFRGARRVLRTHRGFDFGALPLARDLARRIGVPLLFLETTRLLVDPNRSPDHPDVFSEWTAGLPARERRALLSRYHAPHRRRVTRAIRALGRGGAPVVHVAVHSFTPRFRGAVRTTDVGLLYDPRRRLESELVRRWQAALRKALPEWQVRRNDPYRGTSDGLTTTLRRRNADGRYAGIELEVSQRRLRASPATRRLLVAALEATLVASLLAGRARKGADGRRARSPGRKRTKSRPAERAT